MLPAAPLGAVPGSLAGAACPGATLAAAGLALCPRLSAARRGFWPSLHHTRWAFLPALPVLPTNTCAQLAGLEAWPTRAQLEATMSGRSAALAAYRNVLKSCQLTFRSVAIP